MKNKKYHILSILFIIFMVLMAVSTSQPSPKKIKNSISYETREEYFLIKIKTTIDPNNYRLFGSRNSGFQLSFNDPAYNDQKERQAFMIDETGEYITRLYIFNESEGWSLSEETIMDEEDFGTFTENGYFVIRIRNTFLRYENPRLTDIYLSGKNGAYIYELYLE